MSDLSSNNSILLSLLQLSEQEGSIDRALHCLKALLLKSKGESLDILLTPFVKSNAVKINLRHFGGFTVNNIHLNKPTNAKEDALDFIQSDEKPIKHAEFETRFFWKVSQEPTLYDLNSLIFNKDSYEFSTIVDKYILIDDKINIKIRENELQIKILEQKKGDIFQFHRKRKLHFPIKAMDLSDYFSDSLFPETLFFQSAEDFLAKLSDSFLFTCVDVVKKRYVRKIRKHLKIELSHIKINHKEWKTLCIESNKREDVEALNLLVNQKNAQKMNYNTFLCECVNSVGAP